MLFCYSSLGCPPLRCPPTYGVDLMIKTCHKVWYYDFILKNAPKFKNNPNYLVCREQCLQRLGLAWTGSKMHCTLLSALCTGLFLTVYSELYSVLSVLFTFPLWTLLSALSTGLFPTVYCSLSVCALPHCPVEHYTLHTHPSKCTVHHTPPQNVHPTVHNAHTPLSALPPHHHEASSTSSSPSSTSYQCKYCGQVTPPFQPPPPTVVIRDKILFKLTLIQNWNILYCQHLKAKRYL